MNFTIFSNLTNQLNRFESNLIPINEARLKKRVREGGIDAFNSRKKETLKRMYNHSEYDRMEFLKSIKSTLSLSYNLRFDNHFLNRIEERTDVDLSYVEELVTLSLPQITKEILVNDSIRKSNTIALSAEGDPMAFIIYVDFKRGKETSYANISDRNAEPIIDLNFVTALIEGSWEDETIFIDQFTVPVIVNF